MLEVGMDPETLDKIVELSRESAGAASVPNRLAIVPIPGSPTSSFFVVGPDGTYEERTPAIAPRSTALQCVDQVGAFALHARDRWSQRPAVYFTKTSVSILLDDGRVEKDRPNAYCSLTEMKAWTKLKVWSDNYENAWMQHRDFMRCLRVEFADCFAEGALEALSEQIGQLDFVAGERSQSVAVRNRESMGMEVANEIRALTGEIPEEIFLNVRIYRDPVLTRKHEIRCILETDPQRGKLALIPFPGQMEKALDEEMGCLGELLRASVRSAKYLPVDKSFLGSAETSSPNTSAPAPEWQIPVFYGSP